MSSSPTSTRIDESVTLPFAAAGAGVSPTGAGATVLAGSLGMTLTSWEGPDGISSTGSVGWGSSWLTGSEPSG